MNCRQWLRHFFLFFLTGLSGGLYAQKSATSGSGQVLARRAEAAGTVYSTQPNVVSRGQALFQAQCSACHNFLQKGIGPDLSRVTAEASPKWIQTFIRNAPEVIKSGDPRARRLFREYKQEMPVFASLSDNDLQALMAYIHQNRKKEAPAETLPGWGTPIPDPIPAGIADSGLELHLEEVLTAPATDSKVPLARINKMVTVPGSPVRHFLQDMRGTLYQMVDNQLRVYMDFPKLLPHFIPTPGLASGLGSYAFHPEFNTNGLLYTTHTEKANTAPADFAYADSIRVALQWVLTEWKVDNPQAPAFSGSRREMMRVNMVSPIHGVQEITFNPNARPGTPDYGLLYIGIGDGGATENGFPAICNSTARIWSSVLRIDPRGRNSQNGKYGIPPDNPFARDGDDRTLGEVFCRGFRNPNRIYWTPDGKMLITDIGQTNAEELNLGRAGADYGWPDREGLLRISHRARMDRVFALPKDDDRLGYTYPVALYDHDEGKAISGGYLYTSSALPLLAGKYLFGDVVNGRVFCLDSQQLVPGRQTAFQELTLKVAGKTTSFIELCGNQKTDLRFGQGPGDAYYLYTKTDGKIYRIKDCVRK